MPSLGEGIDVPSGYRFSGESIDDLGADSYTLVGIVQDVSSSVHEFKKDMEDCLKSIVGSCKKSQKSEHLMVRLTQFNQDISETHGFKLLSTIGDDDYDDVLDVGGMTALNDATYSGIESVEEYGKILANQDILVNGIVFVITDGMDNRSTFASDPAKITKLRESVIKNENLESLLVILIGIGDDNKVYLDDFKNEANIDQFVSVSDASPETLAKIADFVSRSVSSQSQSLGSGGASQSLLF